MIGFFVVNKPSGTNSTTVVSKIKHAYGQKCGHMGTLDSMAAGVLPVAVGKATKLFDYFLTKDKRYFAIGLFGTETDTLDASGTVLQKQTVNIEKPQIDAVLPQFLGEISQIPPKYSAIKINGTRASDLVRSGKQAEIKQKKVHIYSLSCEKIKDNMFAFEIHSSSGTYVRSLIADIAKALKTVATTVCIIRKSSGPFLIEDSCTMQEIESKTAKLVPIEQVLDLPKVNFNKSEGDRLKNGQTIISNAADGDCLAYCEKNLIGICNCKNNHIKIKISLWEE